MKCPNCGAELDKDSKFCAYCGNDLTKKTTKKNKEEVKEEQKEENKEEVKEDKEVINKPVEKNTTDTVTDGKSTASLVLGICSFVIFCLMLPFSIIGLILGLVSKERSGKRTAAVVINAIALGLSLIVSIVVLLFGSAVSALFNTYEKYSDNNPELIEKFEEELEKGLEEFDNVLEDDEEDKDIKVIGDDYYGYVKVPTSWVEFKDIDGNTSYQYTDIGDMGYIITLNTYEEDISPYTAAININNHIKEEGNESSYTFGRISKYSCYVVNAKYIDGTYLDAYLFKADDGKLHYVSIEGPDKDNDNFDIPDTFSLTKQD